MDISHLNAPQQEAVRFGDAPLLVLAGAGSGKTSVITHRIAHLVEERGVRPYRILGMTFTNKAARQMRARAAALLQCDEAALDIGTFHRICGRILRRHAVGVGLSNRFVIYDGDDQLQVIRRCAAALDLDSTAFPPRALRGCIETWKNAGELPEAARAEGPPLQRRALEVYRLYQKQLGADDAVDFSDMLLHVLTLLRTQPHVAELLRRTWSHLLVDEYQDTNAVQYMLLRELVTAAHSLTVVGDDDQSIYRWRGADIGNILRFERDFPGAGVIRLEQNYRSTQTILEAANGVIAHNVARKGKRLFSVGGSGAKLQLHLFNTEREEGQALAEMVGAGLAAGTPAGETALLFRTNAQSRPLEEALRRLQIPYVVYGGTRFYDRREIKDALAYLRLLDNPRSTVDFLRAVNAPARGVGKTSLGRVLALAAERGLSILDAAAAAAEPGGPLVGRARAGLAGFCQLCEAWRAEQAAGEAPGRLLEHVLRDSGYLEALQQAGKEEGEDRVANLQELVAALDEYADTTPDARLSGFLEDVALATDADAGGVDGQVVLATLHAAKGLEFAAVYLPGLEEGLFPHGRSLEDRAALEEERRLCYVGLTRAKATLVLSAARVRSFFGRPTLMQLSRFVREIPPALMEVFGDEAAALPAAALPTRAGADVGLPPAEYDGVPVVRQEGGGNAYAAGSRVLHASFGEGEVVHVDGGGSRQKLTVRFAEVGQKVIVARFVQPAPAARG